MEYLEGEDLAYKLHRKSALSLTATVRITKQVASALAETHAKGIVHRDLKPANVFIVRVQGEDFAKVLDFGISKVRAASTALTNASTLMGTPMYMAPEQAKGDSRARPPDRPVGARLHHVRDAGRAAAVRRRRHRRVAVPGRAPGAAAAVALREGACRSEVERVVHRALAKQPRRSLPERDRVRPRVRGGGDGQGAARRAGGRRHPDRAPGISLTPVEAAATMASSAETFAPSIQADDGAHAAHRDLRRRRRRGRSPASVLVRGPLTAPAARAGSGRRRGGRRPHAGRPGPPAVEPCRPTRRPPRRRTCRQ